VVTVLLSIYAGSRIARYQGKRAEKHKQATLDTLVTTTVGLLVIVLSLAFSVVILLTVELDRSGATEDGLVLISPQPLIDLQQSINEQMGEAPAQGGHSEDAVTESQGQHTWGAAARNRWVEKCRIPGTACSMGC
jgi:hypothetical protein